MTRSPAFVKLIGRLVAAEPNCGYTSAHQIGALTHAELAAVIAHEPTVVSDAAASDALADSIVHTLSVTSHGSIESATLIGAAFVGALVAQARQSLLYAVQEEIAKDAEVQRADESDERYLATMSAAVRGVWQS